MKKVFCFLSGLGLSLVLIFTCGFENSAAEEKPWFTTPDTVSVIAEQLLNRVSRKSEKPVVRRKFSLKPGPLSRCNSFLVTEFSFSWVLGRPAASTGFQLFTWELGCMVNLDKHSAMGGIFFVGTDLFPGSSRLGSRARYRFWFGENISLDIAPGIIITGKNLGRWNGRYEFPSFTCQVGLNLSEWFGLTGQVDVMRWRKSSYQYNSYTGLTEYIGPEKTVVKPELYLGFKFGTPAGAGAASVVVVIMAGLLLEGGSGF